MNVQVVVSTEECQIIASLRVSHDEHRNFMPAISDGPVLARIALDILAYIVPCMLFATSTEIPTACKW